MNKYVVLINKKYAILDEMDNLVYFNNPVFMDFNTAIKVINSAGNGSYITMYTTTDKD